MLKLFPQLSLYKVEGVWELGCTLGCQIESPNVYNCGRNLSSGEKANKKDRPTCMNKHGKCKARFPREIFEQTQVDSKTGALNMNLFSGPMLCMA